MALGEFVVKHCGSCGAIKSVSEFHRRRDAADGYRNRCKSCSSAYLEQWHAANPEKAREYTRKFRDLRPERDQSNRLRARCKAYGISVERYKEMLEAQDGGCAMCGMTPEELGRTLAVDHDHSCCPAQMKSCGRCVRALLCGSCNTALGYFESLAWTALAGRYLARFG